jgi:hypothetical protein
MLAHSSTSGGSGNGCQWVIQPSGGQNSIPSGVHCSPVQKPSITIGPMPAMPYMITVRLGSGIISEHLIQLLIY